MKVCNDRQFKLCISFLSSLGNEISFLKIAQKQITERNIEFVEDEIDKFTT